MLSAELLQRVVKVKWRCQPGAEYPYWGRTGVLYATDFFFFFWGGGGGGEGGVGGGGVSANARRLLLPQRNLWYVLNP